MQNLLAREINLTDFECGLCLHSPIFIPAIAPYVAIFLPINGWVLWLMISSPVFWTDRMEVSEFHLVLTELLFNFLEILIMSINSNAVVVILSKLITITLTARIQFQTEICVERYLAVTHPVLYLRYKPLRYRMSFNCVVWLQTIVIGVFQMLVCSQNAISVTIYIAVFLYVFIINAYCCLSVLRALKQPSPGEGEREASNLMKKRAFNIVLIFLVTTFFSHVPLITMLLLHEKIEEDILCVLQPLAYCLMIWLGAIHPIHYFLRNEKYQGRNRFCVNCFHV